MFVIIKIDDYHHFDGGDDDNGGAHDDDDATLGKMSVGRQGVVLNRLQYSK